MKLKEVKGITYMQGGYFDINDSKGSHNTDGPARLWVDGVKEWYVNGGFKEEYYPEDWPLDEDET